MAGRKLSGTARLTRFSTYWLSLRTKMEGSSQWYLALKEVNTLLQYSPSSCCIFPVSFLKMSIKLLLSLSMSSPKNYALCYQKDDKDQDEKKWSDDYNTLVVQLRSSTQGYPKSMCTLLQALSQVMLFNFMPILVLSSTQMLAHLGDLTQDQQPLTSSQIFWRIFLVCTAMVVSKIYSSFSSVISMSLSRLDRLGSPLVTMKQNRATAKAYVIFFQASILGTVTRLSMFISLLQFRIILIISRAIRSQKKDWLCNWVASIQITEYCGMLQLQFIFIDNHSNSHEDADR